MKSIASQLFINATIIISAITFVNMLLHDKFKKKLTNKRNMIYGLLSGVLGCVLMIYSVSIPPNIILDFRFIPIIIMGLYFSLATSLGTAIIIGVFRIAYFGVNKVSIIAFIVTLIV
jgi:diguanylate cyclase